MAHSRTPATLSSNGGLVVLREAAGRLDLAAVIADPLADRRNQLFVIHSYRAMVTARMMAIAAGYEDAADLDALRYDPALLIACERAPETGREIPSQPTISRLENLADARTPYRIGAGFIDLFCRSYARPPASIVLDIDDMVHGQQELALFNPHAGWPLLPADPHLRGGLRQADSARRLGELTYGLYASPEYLRSAAPIRTTDDLKRHDLIMHAPRGRPAWTLVKGEKTEKVSQAPRCALNNTMAARNPALSGLGIVQLPRYTAEPHVAEGALARVLPGWARIPVPVHAVFASTRYMDPKVRGFVDLCRDGFRSDVEGLS